MILREILLNISKIDVFVSLKRLSSLFKNGPKASETFLYITPHIDVLEYLKNKQTTQQQLDKRQSNYDLKKLENLWTLYDELKTRKVQLDEKKATISKELMEKMKLAPDGKEVEKLEIQLNLIKENIKKLKGPLWSAEETAVLEALKLPNKLHPLTPEGTHKIIHKYNNLPSTFKDHMVMGKQKNLIQYNKSDNYYLKQDAAIFELGAKFYFSNLLRQNKFIQFSNADFAKSLVVEGCGLDHTDPNKTFILHHNEDSKVNVDNRLHLTGGASIFSFFAYHTKNVIVSKVLPLKYFTMGRKYLPRELEVNNLFNISQSTVIEAFVVAKDITEGDKLLEQLIEIIKQCYEDIGYHFRLSYVSAHNLHMSESLRIAIEMYSTSLNKYVEIGNLAVSGDFICKRLMFTYTEDKQNKFPYIISGTILDVQKLLACALEQDKDFTLPKQFQVDNWYSKEKRTQ